MAAPPGQRGRIFLSRFLTVRSADLRSTWWMTGSAMPSGAGCRISCSTAIRRSYEYLRPAAVRNLYEDHASGRNDNHKILFSLVVCEQWLRVHAEPVAVLS